MIKVVTAKEMARIEQLAYAEGASEEKFMNVAGLGVAELVQWAIAHYKLQPNITLLCGSGNNAGDAYVSGKILLEGGFHVKALACAPFEKSSTLCQLQSRRFTRAGGKIKYLEGSPDIDFFDAHLLIDGLLGTGFHGDVGGIQKDVIEAANASKLPIISVDIPSGIDGTTGEVGGCAIKACNTLFLGLPKTGCFFKNAWPYVGRVHIYNFGLEERYIEKAQADYLLIDDTCIRAWMPVIERTRHKYQAGYVVGLGGSKGMPGAPLMASFAALRAGAGIVRLLHPEAMAGELSAAHPEIIRQGYPEGDENTILEASRRASALFVGPGMGTSDAALQTLKKILPNLEKPCVIDAEALTLLAEHSIPLPSQTIMTPHHGEMKRLLNIHEEIAFREFFDKCQNYANQKNITLVLKGSPTFIFSPNQKPFVCSRGDPGMATAGSGDVLTGVIAGLLAQLHDPLKAAVLGVHLHAVAGEYAAERFTSYCMTATDITASLPNAFRKYINF